jgi:hypothetical protein
MAWQRFVFDWTAGPVDHPITLNAHANAQSFAAHAVNGTIGFNAFTNASTFAAHALRGQIGLAAHVNAPSLPAFAVNGRVALAAHSNTSTFGQFTVGSSDHPITLAALASSSTAPAFAVNGRIGFTAYASPNTFPVFALNGAIGFASHENAQAFPQLEIIGPPADEPAEAPARVGGGRKGQDDDRDTVESIYELLLLRTQQPAPIPQKTLTPPVTVARAGVQPSRAATTEGDTTEQRRKLALLVALSEDD